MATQFSYREDYLTPETEYRAEELKKQLQYQLANFSPIRFKKAVQMRMSLPENNK